MIISIYHSHPSDELFGLHPINILKTDDYPKELQELDINCNVTHRFFVERWQTIKEIRLFPTEEEDIGNLIFNLDEERLALFLLTYA